MTQCNEDFARASTSPSTPGERRDIAKHLFAPTFLARDSDQVAPFFQTHSHSRFHTDDTQDEEIDNAAEDEHCEDDGSWEASFEGQKRTKKKRKHLLLPANLRIGNMLVIAQIHAKPACLPLPTLSKVRRPIVTRSFYSS